MKISRTTPCYYLTSVAKDRLHVFQTDKVKQILTMQLKNALLQMVGTLATTGCVLIVFCSLPSIASSQQTNGPGSRPPKTETGSSLSPLDYERYLTTVNLKNWDDGGDLSRFVYLHTSMVFPAADVRREGPVSVLRQKPDPGISAYQVHLADGRVMSFDQFVTRAAMVDGIVIIHKGRIVYEGYPHMDQSDKHLLFSVTKAYIGTLVGMLEADGSVNVSRPIEAYIPELNGTAWAGTSIRDILDMASGIDAPDGDIENPKSQHYRLEASLGWLEMTPELPDSVKSGLTFDFLKTLGRASAPGKYFVYSSANTFVLAWLIEKITGRRVYDVLSERIWSKIGAESDAQFVVNRRGIAISHAGLVATVRDMARFGLLFTPSRNVVASRAIIPANLITALEKGRKELVRLRRKADGQSSEMFGAYQWEEVTADAAFMKTGYAGQLLYVSPRKDLVVAYVGSEEFKDTHPTFNRVVRQVLQHSYHATPGQ